MAQNGPQALALSNARRRAELTTLHRKLQIPIDDLDRRVLKQASQRHQAQRLMTHPAVGPITALATEMFLGNPRRFLNGKAVASYVGLIPSEHSSGSRPRLGALSKEGNPRWNAQGFASILR